MKTIIAGSRSITNYITVLEAIQASGFVVTEIVSGGANGVDKIGEKVATDANMTPKIFPALWDDLDVEGAVIKTGKYGKYNAIAGHQRNAQMAEYADQLIAIWDGKSTGTKDMIARSKALGLKIYIHIEDVK